MVLEATMICVDNSDYMRNGDFSPSRFQGQSDAINLIYGAKTQSNPENSVGVLTMAGKHARVLVTPTTDLGKLFGCLHGEQRNLGGKVNLTAAINVAQLALKHRQNKNHRQRIIVFAGSRVDSDQKDLVKIGNNLRKNSVAIDVINFGGEDDREKELKLTALVDAVNKNSNTCSHIINIPSGGPGSLSDVLLTTPIFRDSEDGGASTFAAATGGAAGFEFGVDPNMDPELVLALRMSMEEERARQETSASPNPATEENASMSADFMNEDENALLQQALAISMEEYLPSSEEEEEKN